MTRRRRNIRSDHHGVRPTFDHAVPFASESTLKLQTDLAKALIADVEMVNELIDGHRGASTVILTKEHQLDLADVYAAIHATATLRIDDELPADMDRLADLVYWTKRNRNVLKSRYA